MKDCPYKNMVNIGQSSTHVRICKVKDGTEIPYFYADNFTRDQIKRLNSALCLWFLVFCIGGWTEEADHLADVILQGVHIFPEDQLREGAKKVFFLLAVPLRRRWGGKGPTIKEKIIFFNLKKIPTAIKLEEWGVGKALMTRPLKRTFCGFN